MRMQWGSRQSTMSLHPLASLTSVNVLSDIVLNSRPPIIASDKLHSFIATWVSSKGRIVVFMDNVFSEFGMNGNVNTFSESD
jgi:hypothetical protein